MSLTTLKIYAVVSAIILLLIRRREEDPFILPYVVIYMFSLMAAIKNCVY